MKSTEKEQLLLEFTNIYNEMKYFNRPDDQVDGAP